MLSIRVGNSSSRVNDAKNAQRLCLPLLLLHGSGHCIILNIQATPIGIHTSKLAVLLGPKLQHPFDHNHDDSL